MNVLKTKSTLHFLVLALAIAISAGHSPSAYGDEMVRPEDYQAWESGGTTQTHFHIPGSSVAWADYEALRRDFPSIRGLTETQIDSWIIDNFAYLSEAQLRLRGIRVDDFAVDLNRSAPFFHPPDYNRASVAIEHAGFSSGSNQSQLALIDLKGTGHGNPSNVESQVRSFEAAKQNLDPARALDEIRIHDHSDGMMTLGEAIAEVTRQKAVQAGFDLVNARTGSSHQTVESYFVIHLPVSILKDKGRSDPAAIYGRQPHIRGSGRLEIPPQVYQDDFGGRQASALRSAVDFGGVVILQPKLISTFGDPRSITVSTRQDAQLSLAWRYAHQTANYFVANVQQSQREARHAVHAHVQTMLAPVAAELGALPRLSREENLRRYLTQRVHASDNKRVVGLVLKQMFRLGIEDWLEPIFKHGSALMRTEAFSMLIQNPNFAPGTQKRQRVLGLAQQTGPSVFFDAFVVAMLNEGPEFAKSAIALASTSSLPQATARAFVDAPIENLSPHLPLVLILSSRIGKSGGIPQILGLILSRPDLNRSQFEAVIQEITRLRPVVMEDVLPVIVRTIIQTGTTENRAVKLLSQIKSANPNLAPTIDGVVRRSNVGARLCQAVFSPSN